MFQLERRYIVPQHGNTVRLLPSALPPRLTNEARGANRAAHERWDCEVYHTRTHTHTHLSYTHVLMQKNGGGVRQGRAPQPCCLNSLQKACDSSPSPLTCATGAASRLFLRQGNRQNAPDAPVKILQRPKIKRGKEGKAKGGPLPAFSRAGTV